MTVFKEYRQLTAKQKVKVRRARWIAFFAVLFVTGEFLLKSARADPCDFSLNYTLPVERTNTDPLSLEEIAAVTLFGADETGALTVFNLTEFSVVPKQLNQEGCQGHTIMYHMVVQDTLGLISSDSNGIRVIYPQAPPNSPVINTIERTGQNVTMRCRKCKIRMNW